MGAHGNRIGADGGGGWSRPPVVSRPRLGQRQSASAFPAVTPLAAAPPDRAHRMRTPRLPARSRRRSAAGRVRRTRAAWGRRGWRQSVSGRLAARCGRLGGLGRMRCQTESGLGGPWRALARGTRRSGTREPGIGLTLPVVGWSPAPPGTRTPNPRICEWTAGAYRTLCLHQPLRNLPGTHATHRFAAGTRSTNRSTASTPALKDFVTERSRRRWQSATGEGPRRTGPRKL
jgi:hypothetical protein